MHAALTCALQQIFAEGQAGAKSQAQVANTIADAIDVFVKSGTVTTTVTGTDSMGGPVVGARTGTVTWSQEGMTGPCDYFCRLTNWRARYVRQE
jgi:hypothetical protein